MSTMKGVMRRVALWAAVGALGAVGTVTVARAQLAASASVASDKAGAILVYPKVVVDTCGHFGHCSTTSTTPGADCVLATCPGTSTTPGAECCPGSTCPTATGTVDCVQTACPGTAELCQPGPNTDTEVQVINTSNSITAARCFLVNTTSHCDNQPDRACTDETASARCPLGGHCVAGWQKTDFRMTLTKRQPVSWDASEGLSSFPLDPNAQPPKFGPGGQSNGFSFVPPSPEDPFFGEIKCVEADPQSFNPIPGFDPANNGGGDLAGVATIVSANAEGTLPFPSVDARKYNAIGIQAIPQNMGTLLANPDKPLCLGGGVTNDCPEGPEYDGCPNALILNHFFDDAVVVTHAQQSAASVVTDLTVVPCSEDFQNGANNLGGAILQFLVYNEFEQRFSTSTHFTCWKEVQLSDITTNPGPADDKYSIFNYAVQGTLTGQTFIRPVVGATTGNTVLGIAEEFWTNEMPSADMTPTNGAIGHFSTAGNLHFSGTRDVGDELILSTDVTPGE